MTVSARYFDGKNSKAHSVSLETEYTDLVVFAADGAEIARWPLDQLRDENIPVSASEVTLSRGDDDPARILCDDMPFIRELGHACPALHKKRDRAPGWWRPIVLIGGTAVASVALFLLVGLPALGSAIANMIPYDVRLEIGQAAEQQLTRRFAKEKNAEEAVCSSNGGQAALDKLLAQFSSASDAHQRPVSVIVVKSKHANAFALPGGRMIVLSALIDMADSPNALAGILAHEFGHIEGKHPTSLFVTNMGLAAMLSLAFGDVTGGTIIAGVGQMALGAAYSRDFERFADQRAIDLMAHWNYDISPMVPLMDELGKKTDDDSLLSTFFSTHPHTDERHDMLAEAGKKGGGTALTDIEWNAVKVMCQKSI